MLYIEEKISQQSASAISGLGLLRSTDHNTEAETEGRGEESIAVLNSKIPLSRDALHHQVHAYDTRTHHACCQAILAVKGLSGGGGFLGMYTDATGACHDPTSCIIVEDHFCVFLVRLLVEFGNSQLDCSEAEASRVSPLKAV